MNSAFRISPRLLDTFDDRIDILFRELELAIKWQRPSLLFAVYASESVRAEAENSLRVKLSTLGQKVIPIQVKDQSNSNIVQTINAIHGAYRSIFFVSGLDLGGKKDGPNSYTSLNIHREFFVENQILIVFWLSEKEAINLAHFAPDFWVFRHRVIEFVDVPKQVQDSPQVFEPAAMQPVKIFEAKKNISQNTGTLPLPATSEEAASTNANLLLTLGVLNWRRGNNEKAASLIEAALAASLPLKDKWFEAKCFNAIALVKTEQGKFEQAIKAYQQAMRLAPDRIFPWNNMGNLYHRLNRSNEAIDAFQKAIGHNPKDAVSWNGLGNVLSILGQTDKAIHAYQRAIMCAPTFVNPVIGLADAYVRSGRLNTAITVYKKAIELNDKLVEPMLSLGKIYIEQGNRGEAIKIFQKAVSVDPDLAVAWDELGRLYLSTNSYADVITVCKKAIALDRSLGSAYIHLGQAYYFTRKYSQSVIVYQKALEQLKTDKERAIAWVGLGDAYWQINDFSHAMAAYGRAKKFNGPTLSPRPEVTEKSILIAEDQCEEVCDIPAASVEVNEIIEQTELINVEPVSNASIAVDQVQPVAFVKELLAEAGLEFAAEEKVDLTSAVVEEPIASGRQNPAVQSDENFEDAAEWNNLGHHFLHERSYDKAIEAYTRAIELSSDSHWPYIRNLALAHYKKGKNNGDAADISDLAEHETIDQTLTIHDAGVETMTQALVSRSDVAAEGLIQSLSPEQAGGSAEHEIRLEDFSMGAGAFDVEDLETPLSENKPSPAMLSGEEWSVEAIQDPAQSFTYQSGLLQETMNSETLVFASEETQTEDPAVYAVEWCKLGDLYLKVGSYDEATEAYQKAVKLNPKYATAVGNMALAYYHKGLYVESISMYLKCIDLHKDNKEKAIIWNRLGDAYRRLNNEKSAMAAYQKAARLDSVRKPLLSRARMALLGNVRG